MGLCSKCRDFYPPDFIDNHMCHFCKKETNVIMSENGEMFNRQDVIRDYKELLNMIKEKGSVKNIEFESMIQKGMKE